jgi:hypothetical protein
MVILPHLPTVVAPVFAVRDRERHWSHHHASRPNLTGLHRSMIQASRLPSYPRIPRVAEQLQDAPSNQRKFDKAFVLRPQTQSGDRNRC